MCEGKSIYDYSNIVDGDEKILGPGRKNTISTEKGKVLFTGRKG